MQTIRFGILSPGRARWPQRAAAFIALSLTAENTEDAEEKQPTHGKPLCLLCALCLPTNLRELLCWKARRTGHGWKKIAEDRAGRADTRPAQSFSPETVFAPCQRREHHPLSSSSIRGFLTSDLPAKVRSLRKPSYCRHTPANARVQGLRAIYVPLSRNSGCGFSLPSHA
jgi:hypothetical protein